MPRMYADSTVSDPENGVPASRLTLGAMLLSCERLVAPLCSSVSALMAVIAMGTCCTSSTRLVAVTTISSSISPLAVVVSCALTVVAADTASADITSQRKPCPRLFGCLVMFLPPLRCKIVCCSKTTPPAGVHWIESVPDATTVLDLKRNPVRRPAHALRLLALVQSARYPGWTDHEIRDAPDLGARHHFRFRVFRPQRGQFPDAFYCL